MLDVGDDAAIADALDRHALGQRFEHGLRDRSAYAHAVPSFHGIDGQFQPALDFTTETMRGACAGCPSSTMTLKAGIENLLKHYVPQVTGVEAAL